MQGHRAQPEEGSHLFRGALPVAERAGDVEVRGVRLDRLHARGDPFGDGQELRVQVFVVVAGKVPVGVEDAAFRHGDHHPALPGLV
ncbi:hypothetical protein [Streptomyces virginiae]|uniref:hypothetical protein n=1 Tax=Streptomyces virginiae TaxID=1961 RepID=UPI00224F678D|nr:hypothetical protein [Streptomyces virginiae]MCX4721877.1 hypothetical protein [Streptomyces virginiae]MCX5276774.1 hypothetical protein [Streptomyces virginiae]